MREDEVVLCLFEGTEEAVRRAAARARDPVRADPRSHAALPGRSPTPEEGDSSCVRSATPNRHRPHRTRRSRSRSAQPPPAGPTSAGSRPLDSDQRADPGRQPARAGPERRRRAARDLEPRQLADVDLRDAALARPGRRPEPRRSRQAGEGNGGLAPRRHARQDVAAVRAAGATRAADQHVHRSGGRGTLDAAERRLAGAAPSPSPPYVIGATADEGRPAGDRLARKRGGEESRPARSRRTATRPG